MKQRKEEEEFEIKKEEVGKNEMKKNGNDYFFRRESERVCQTMKSAELKKFRIQDGIVLDSGRLSPEFQSRTQDLKELGVNTTVPITCMQCGTMFSSFFMTTDLDILRDPFVSAGLIIRRDAWGVEEFLCHILGLLLLQSEIMDLVARGVDERCDVAAARCDDSTPVVSVQVMGCKLG